MQKASDYRDIILTIGLSPVDGEHDVFRISYPQFNGYTICVDVANEHIEYIDKSVRRSARITVGDGTTSNFSRPENFVVLDCVVRLLNKGYAPSAVELEKVYPSGRGHSGRLDVLVKDTNNKPFLMFECKTWGAEYRKEREKMLRDGGQLFTYYKNATATRHLCLYASHLIDGSIEYINSIVDVQDEWIGLSETKDIYGYWNKIFKDNGIFEDYVMPYNIIHKRLTYGALKNMRNEDSGKIYNQIMEILRHNGISDKPNAFNKLLNLFVCKIIDEENSNSTDELEFQTWDGLTDEELQMTLNDLYKSGMQRFLNIDVIDLTTEDIEKIISRSENGNKTVERERLIDLRLKKSPTFAFVEVLDNKTFILNAKIVREIVELLQWYKFRYEQKHEFLGEFFEKLLNDSMKQEAGQFFTPVPIARFIIASLPLKNLVQDNIDTKASEPLPAVIDYACGSGHFLTEYMSQMQNIIQELDISKATKTVKGKMNSWRGDVKFLWAEDYVYGIDFDNRLVKTTKVSAFFNGDGEANVVWANGLDSFQHAAEYRDKLKKLLPGSKRDNGQFDILISNPPYSVQAFKSMLKNGADSFELFDGLTDKSSEIECLFVERMKQLLKVGGWAGVILPTSMLSNSGIYTRTREIIFKYFNVKSIVELGSGTFMKTGTNTVILFLERRSDNDHEKITQAINSFFSDGQDVTVAGIERAFSKFVANVYDDLAFDDYISFVNGAASKTMKLHELWLDYAKEYGDNPYAKALVVEREKILYFLLTYEQNIVVVKSGQKQDEKAFLGYEFSERRGYEGIRFLPVGTMLFDENSNELNPQKINSYIYNSFLGKSAVEINEAVAKHVSYGRISNFFEYGTKKFDKRVNLSKKAKFTSEYPLVRLRECVNITGGLWTGNKPPFKTVCVIRNTDFTLDGKLIPDNIAEIEVEENAFKSRKLINGDIVLEKSGGSSSQAVGRVVLFDIQDGDYSHSNFTSCLRTNRDNIDPRYLYRILHKFYTMGGTFPLQKDGKSQLKNLDVEGYLDTKIPLPPLDIQRKIVAEFEAIEQKEIEYNSNIVSSHKSLLNIDYFAFSETRLDRIADMVRRGKSAKYGRSKVQIIKSGQARGYMEFDFTERYYVDDSFVSDERNLQRGDLLINSTGVGTAGRITLFNLDGDFVVDSHITILRLNPQKALPKYVLYALANIGFKNIEAMATGQSGQIEISLDIIKSIRIPLPSLESQKDIIAEIEKREAEIFYLTAQLDELKTTKAVILDKYL